MSGYCIACGAELDYCCTDLGLQFADCDNPNCPLAEEEEIEVAA